MNRSSGRDIHLYLWYPAEGGKQTVNFSDYVTAGLASDKRNHSVARSVFLQRVAELSGDTSLFVSNVPNLLAAKMKAYKNAAVAKGIFPLLIFPDNPYGQSILCEYLASHGFFVLSPQIQGTYEAPMSYDVKGIETAVDDLKFALSYMRQHFSIAPSFGLMGVGFNATNTLALQMRNTDAGAYISLEGGITTGFEEGPLSLSPYYDLQRCTAPMLIIHAPHPDVKPELTYKYKFAERIYQRYPKSSEFYFLNYGIWEKHFKNIFPKANKGATWQSFERAALSIKNFLEWRLKNASSVESFFDRKFTDSLVETSTVPAKPLPPTDKQLLTILESEGMSGMVSFYNKRKTQDAQPFTFGSFFRIGQSFVQNAAFENLLKWAGLFSDSYPASAIPYSMLGRAHLETGKKEEAKKYYTTALQKLETDEELNADEKKVYRQAVENRLKQLQ